MVFFSMFSSGSLQEDSEMYPLNPLNPFLNNPTLPLPKDHAMLEDENSNGNSGHDPTPSEDFAMPLDEGHTMGNPWCRKLIFTCSIPFSSSLSVANEPLKTSLDNLATPQSARDVMPGALVPLDKPPHSHAQASPQSERLAGPSSQMTIYNPWRSTSRTSDHLSDSVIVCAFSC